MSEPTAANWCEHGPMVEGECPSCNRVAAFRFRRRPPMQRCPRCGRQFPSWAEQRLCVTCRRETQPDSSTLVQMIREQRAERELVNVPLPGQLSLLAEDPVAALNPSDAEIPY